MGRKGGEARRGEGRAWLVFEGSLFGQCGVSEAGHDRRGNRVAAVGIECCRTEFWSHLGGGSAQWDGMDVRSSWSNFEGRATSSGGRRAQPAAGSIDSD